MNADLRFVFDTNKMISAICFPRSFGLRAFTLATAIGVVLTTELALAELSEVVGRPKFDAFADRATRSKFFDLYVAESKLIQISGTLKACRDPTDDKFLELAVIGQAQFIVTRDKDLLVPDPFQGVQILDAESLVALLAAQSKGA